MRFDGEHAAVAALAHERLKHADVRRSAADGPPHNRFTLLKFLAQLRKALVHAAVQRLWRCWNLEQGGDDELEETEE
jgi:hypothetical protein